MNKKIILAAVLFLLAGCNYNIQKQSPTPVTELAFTTGSEISYQIVAEQVIAPMCYECHDGAKRGVTRGGVDLSSYQNVFLKRESVLSDVLDGTMPKAGSPALSSYQKRLIVAWLEAGAQEFANQAPPTQPPVVKPPVVIDIPNIQPNEISFSLVFEKVISTNCLQCHKGPDLAEDVPNLETYENVKAVISDVKYDIEQNWMPKPPPKGIPLTDAQKKFILDWIANGAVENPAPPVTAK